MIRKSFFTKGNGALGLGFQARLEQVHGEKCLVIDRAYDGKPPADAFVTKNSNITLNIVTADCAPVLFQGTDPDGEEIIGAAHAGWRGALSGVCENTIKEMVGLGAVKAGIKAMIGPCIKQQSYEVNEEFKQTFLSEDNIASPFFIAGKTANKYQFNLSGYIEARLQRANIGRVNVDQRDTYTDLDFLSYRRMTHLDKITKERQTSAIVILDD